MSAIICLIKHHQDNEGNEKLFLDVDEYMRLAMQGHQQELIKQQAQKQQEAMQIQRAQASGRFFGSGISGLFGSF